MTVFMEVSLPVSEGIFKVEKKVVGRRPLAPGRYEISHEPVSAGTIDIGKDDSMTLHLNTLKLSLDGAIGNVRFAGQGEDELRKLKRNDVRQLTASAAEGKRLFEIGPDSLFRATLAFVSMDGSYVENTVADIVLGRVTAADTVVSLQRPRNGGAGMG